MLRTPTGSEITSVLEKKAKDLINFKVLTDVHEISELVKVVGADLVRLLNTDVLDARLSPVQRFEFVCQSILVALDDAEKVGTKLLEGSIATEKTKDALKRIEEARNFVKNQLPQMLHLSLVVNDALADGRIEMREVVDVVQAAQKIECSTACFAWFGLCFQKKAVAVVGAVAVPVPAPEPAAAAAAPPAAAPESPTPQPPLTPPQGEPEPLEAPAPPQSSDAPAAPETKPENV